uniref:Uncharacterized protein n=1 Tax=Trichogramma kaykai TaxID=54128 RepID=A0ABD2XBU6_9HYME
MSELEVFIMFVGRSGYKDEPKLDTDDKPSSRRTTPVHHVVKQDCNIMTHMIRLLFEIYNRYDVNYTDQSGLSHFHVACRCGFDDAVEKFLELGQDPNCLWPETGDSPLRLAVLDKKAKEVVKLLVRSGVDPNLANKDGLTLLHIISARFYLGLPLLAVLDLAKLLFEIAEEKQQPLQVNARDKYGNTPLHFAVLHYNDYVTKMLLRKGADPNAANDEGSTPLYEFFKRDSFFNDVKSSVDLFFKICVEVNQSVQNRGYQLKRSDALTIMKFFAKYRLFEKSKDLEKCWYDNEKFIKKAKEIWICPGMSHIPNILHDNEWFKIREEMKVKPNLPLDEVVRLRPEEAAKLLTYEDYWKFACSYHLMANFTFYLDCGKYYEELSALHLCEKLSREFFRSWALYLFMELIQNRLPILCCDMITEELKNEDLCNICLAATDRSS